jgi:hypothetical protein
MPEAHEARAVDEGLFYASRYLKCGLVAPVCKGSSEAKVAFYRRWR